MGKSRVAGPVLLQGEQREEETPVLAVLEGVCGAGPCFGPCPQGQKSWVLSWAAGRGLPAAPARLGLGKASFGQW